MLAPRRSVECHWEPARMVPAKFVFAETISFAEL
jgi:hypothetical protein